MSLLYTAVFVVVLCGNVQEVTGQVPVEGGSTVDWSGDMYTCHCTMKPACDWVSPTGFTGGEPNVCYTFETLDGIELFNNTEQGEAQIVVENGKGRIVLKNGGYAELGDWAENSQCFVNPSVSSCPNGFTVYLKYKCHEQNCYALLTSMEDEDKVGSRIYAFPGQVWLGMHQEDYEILAEGSRSDGEWNEVVFVVDPSSATATFPGQMNVIAYTQVGTDLPKKSYGLYPSDANNKTMHNVGKTLVTLGKGTGASLCEVLGLEIDDIFVWNKVLDRRDVNRLFD